MSTLATITVTPPAWESYQREIHEVIADWAKTLQMMGQSPKTIDGYLYWLDKLRGFRGEAVLGGAVDLLALTERDVVAYLSSRAERGHEKEGTVKALRSFYGWAMRNGVVQTNPVAAIPSRRMPEKPLNPLSREDLTRVLVAASWRFERRGWAILLAAATGARRESLCAVEEEDISATHIWFRVAKGGKPYQVPLSSTSRAAIQGLLTAPRPVRGPTTEWRTKLVGVSPSGFWTWVNEAAKDAGLAVHPHSLRHFFATVLACEAKVSTRVFMELMNHSDPGQMKRYAHPDERELREAVEFV